MLKVRNGKAYMVGFEKPTGSESNGLNLVRATCFY